MLSPFGEWWKIFDFEYHSSLVCSNKKMPRLGASF